LGLKGIKRALLGLAARAGYRITKIADREQSDRVASGSATTTEEELAQATEKIRALNWELACQYQQLQQAQRELDETRTEAQPADSSINESKLAITAGHIGPTTSLQQVNSNARGSLQERPTFYIAHFPYHHDRLYGENLSEFFSELGIRTTIVLLDDPANGQRPQLAECLSGDALGVIGFNSQLDRSYVGDTPFLTLAAKQRVPVIQWILDHPSSRLSEFGNSSAGNSRFLFSAKSAETYFKRFGIRNALTATVACVGPSRYSRAKNLTIRDFRNRPFNGIVAINLARIGGTIDDAGKRVRSLDPPLRRVVEQTIESCYLDLIEPLEIHFERALVGSELAIPDTLRHTCMQMIEEIVQIRRRQKIFEIAREFPLLIQSDLASRPLQPGAKATFKENQDVAVTWARLKLSRAHVSISNMHDMVHDRILNGLNAGCVNIVEDNYANRRVFEHGRDALFFRYGDDSLRECLEIVSDDLERSFEIAMAGFARRDDAPFRFGNFQNIIDLAQRPFPASTPIGLTNNEVSKRGAMH
jgi:hypothetical protein